MAKAELQEMGYELPSNEPDNSPYWVLMLGGSSALYGMDAFLGYAALLRIIDSMALGQYLEAIAT